MVPAVPSFSVGQEPDFSHEMDGAKDCWEARKMARVILEIPSEILDAAKMTPQELVRELAVLLYQQGKLSFGKAKELAGMDTWEFLALLASRKIPCSYDLEEYEKDKETLKRLGRI
jgi:predicted HTH domain antitoxin